MFTHIYQRDHILMFVPRILYSLLSITSNAQYINNKICIVKYSYMFRCVYNFFRESLLIYAKVTILVNQ